MMKQDFRSFFLVKAAALLLTVACGVTATFGWLYCISRWESLFENDGRAYSPAWNQAIGDHYDTLLHVISHYDSLRRGNSLGYLDEKQYHEMLSALEPSATNFRYIIRDNATGELLFSSSGEDSLANVPADGLLQSLLTKTPSEVYYNYREYDQEHNLTLFYNDNGTLIYETDGNVPRIYEEGDIYQYAIEYRVDPRYPVEDAFSAARNAYTKGDIRVLYLAVATTAAFLIGTVFLLCCAGRRPKAEDFILNWTDRIPYDLYLLVLGWAVILLGFFGLELLVERFVYATTTPFVYAAQWGAAALLMAAFALGEAVFMSTATRCKTHTLLKNTVIWRILCWVGRLLQAIGRWFGTVFGSWSLTSRVVLLFLLYLLGSILTAFTIILFIPFQAAVLYGLCRWCMGWAAIRKGTTAIVGGQPDATIDTDCLTGPICRELRVHAGQLNDLGGAISSAVDERMKSERMKAELITNVSHDLKTPLTSIINYVDLLKKADIQDETAREYIEVLERKSQRLKKLTEDLVEASKASTGTLPVNAERIGIVQLVKQALGEYEEKLTGASLTPVVTLPEEEVYVWADGRHLWRILDNLMGNCVKYAMAGTRVYLDVVAWDGRVTLSLKNVSAQQLNIPVEQLMERFVRGDESRTTEGSGLGLSIARSLTELGGGTFRLDVDGDLFKAVVSLPQVK